MVVEISGMCPWPWVSINVKKKNGGRAATGKLRDRSCSCDIYHFCSSLDSKVIKVGKAAPVELEVEMDMHSLCPNPNRLTRKGYHKFATSTSSD